MGFDVHVARNDQGRVWNGQRLGDMPRRRKQLPRQFDPAVNRTIELIDVLWLDGNIITAAFEIESTTSIYSGLLRMSDLLAQQPNINIPLFLVAPEERREKVIEQVNRPTFESMSQPLTEVCRYIPFEGLRDSLKTVTAAVVRCDDGVCPVQAEVAKSRNRLRVILRSPDSGRESLPGSGVRRRRTSYMPTLRQEAFRSADAWAGRRAASVSSRPAAGYGLKRLAVTPRWCGSEPRWSR